MRNLLRSLAKRGIGADRSDAARGRPEALRRKTIATNARLILITSMLATPVAVFMLLGGALMPFVISVIGLCAGFMTLELQRRSQYERAAFGQVYATLTI